MKVKLAGLVVLVHVLLANPVRGYAHHSDAAYITTTVDINNATITRVAWANPHGIISFDAKDEKGQVAHWAVEMGSPSSMATIGWTRNTVSPGEVVTIRLFPARNGAPLGRLSTITYPDGKVLNYRAGR